MSKIPKVIHYVWLGRGEKDARTKHCIETWKQFLPDYEIKEWNEDNLPMNELGDFFTQAYENRKWAFASDVARLYALYTEGGIYMDTDVEVYKSLDEFLDCDGFTGFEDVHYPVCATMGAVKENPIIGMMLDYYKAKDFIMYDDWRDYIKYQETSTCVYSNILSLMGIDRDKNVEQHIKYFSVYPQSYFFTKDEGYTWHSFNGSW